MCRRLGRHIWSILEGSSSEVWWRSYPVQVWTWEPDEQHRVSLRGQPKTHSSKWHLTKVHANMRAKCQTTLIFLLIGFWRARNEVENKFNQLQILALFWKTSIVFSTSISCHQLSCKDEVHQATPFRQHSKIKAMQFTQLCNDTPVAAAPIIDNINMFRAVNSFKTSI